MDWRSIEPFRGVKSIRICILLATKVDVAELFEILGNYCIYLNAR
jgi:hypothetical protein